MTAASLDPLTHVLGRLHGVLGSGAPADDTALAVVTRFLTTSEPTWLRARPDTLRLDVLTVSAVLAGRR